MEKNLTQQDRAELDALLKRIGVSQEAVPALLTLVAQLATQRAPVTAPAPAAAPVVDPVLKPLAWGARVSPEFRTFVRQMAVDFSVPSKGIIIDPDWFMACMAFETMETFSPSIRPKRKDGTLISSAVGLIQFLKAVATEIGTTTDKLAAMTAEKQLEFVWKYFRLNIKRFGNIQSLEDCYMMIHWPAAVGKPLEHVMYYKGTSAFAANAGLDTDKNGQITKREAGQLVRAKLTKGLLSGNLG